MNDETQPELSFAAEVWKTLSAINVNKHVEKKDIGRAKLSYLSWTWAWQTLMEYYPESDVEHVEPRWFEDRSCEVWSSVTVKKGEQSHTRSCWLPVMDHRNNAAIEPTSRQISDARQRCLTKCIALHGLGLYIYAGEDLPEESKHEAEKEAAEKAEKAEKAAAAATKAKKEDKQRLADWTCKVDECTSLETLRATLDEARNVFRKHNCAEEYKELVRIVKIKGKEIEKRQLENEDVPL